MTTIYILYYKIRIQNDDKRNRQDFLTKYIQLKKKKITQIITFRYVVCFLYYF